MFDYTMEHICSYTVTLETPPEPRADRGHPRGHSFECLRDRRGSYGA